MDFGLKDRVALVAAASRGIGFAAARELAREGARVFLCSGDEARASEAAQKVNDGTGATEGVTLNNVAPGYTMTERQDELAEARSRAMGKSKQELVDLWSAQTPMRRMAAAEEIAAAIAFLASERASYITGVTLQVDGGWVRSLL